MITMPAIRINIVHPDVAQDWERVATFTLKNYSICDTPHEARGVAWKALTLPSNQQKIIQALINYTSEFTPPE